MRNMFSIQESLWWGGLEVKCDSDHDAQKLTAVKRISPRLMKDMDLFVYNSQNSFHAAIGRMSSHLLIAWVEWVHISSLLGLVLVFWNINDDDNNDGG